jgi:hypothetical protein
MAYRLQFLGTAFKLADKGLASAEKAFRLLRRGIEGKSKFKDWRNHPTDSEVITATFANRLLWLSQSKQTDPRKFAEEVCRAFRKGFGNGNSGKWDLRQLMGIPLATGSLSMQEARRLMMALQSVRPALWPDFFAYLFEVFGDLRIYFTLEYGRDLDRRKADLEKHPGDDGIRLAYAKTLMKCGLFEDAKEQLDRVKEKREYRSAALYMSQVNSYFLGNFEASIDSGIQQMEGDPKQVRSRYWLWQAAQKVGGYPVRVPQQARMEVTAGREPSTLEFRSVASKIGLDKVSGGRGTAVLDVTGDGTLDLVIAGAHSGCSLFLNNGDGTFRDASVGSGLDKCVYAFSVAAGDFDNDGRQDLFISGLGFFDGQGALFRNNGDGTFSDVTKEAGLSIWGPAFTAIWVDYDGDGWLDLYIANNLGGLFDVKTPNRLFRNNRNGTFTDVTRGAGLSTEWNSLGATWGDFRNNGLQDLFVSNFGGAQLFRNNGDGTFTDVSEVAGIDKAVIGSSAIACDIDQDGWLDIVQFTYSRPEDAIHTLRYGQGPRGGFPMRVYRNNRDGSFTDIAPDLNLTGCWGTMSGAVGDVSNNGYLDILLGNGDPQMDRNEPPILLEGSDLGYRNTTFSAGLPAAGKGHGVNMADLSGDGRMHLIVSSGGLYPGDLMTTEVYRPVKRVGNFINVRLQGVQSNRDAVGARIRLRSEGRDQYRIVSGGSGFGYLPLEQHFGLGNASKAEALEIRWPSGHIQFFDEIPGQQTIRIVEQEADYSKIY